MSSQISLILDNRIALSISFLFGKCLMPSYLTGCALRGAGASFLLCQQYSRSRINSNLSAAAQADDNATVGFEFGLLISSATSCRKDAPWCTVRNTFLCVCVCVCVYTHTRTHARAHIHTHTHTHTHTLRTYRPMEKCGFIVGEAMHSCVCRRLADPPTTTRDPPFPPLSRESINLSSRLPTSRIRDERGKRRWRNTAKNSNPAGSIGSDRITSNGDIKVVKNKSVQFAWDCYIEKRNKFVRFLFNILIDQIIAYSIIWIYLEF